MFERDWTRVIVGLGLSGILKKNQVEHTPLVHTQITGTSGVGNEGTGGHVTPNIARYLLSTPLLQKKKKRKKYLIVYFS